MKIGNLRVNQIESPICIDGRAPVFSFSASQEGIFCVSLYLRGEDVPEQECVVTSAECGGFRFRNALQQGRQYRWEVSDGEQVVAASFETGIDFRFRWISPTVDTGSSPCFVRFFYAPRECRKARLYIAANCLYRTFLNGERVGRSYLTGGEGSYGLQYHAYDVGELLWREEENEMCVVMSDRKTACLAAGLVLTDGRGKHMTVATDESWRVLESGCLLSPGLEREVWELPDAHMASQHVCVCRSLGFPKPTVEIPLTAAAVLRPKPRCLRLGDRAVFDFGRVIDGIVRLRISLPKREHVRLLFYESLESAHRPVGEFSFVSDGGARVYEPIFSHFRFRYVCIASALRKDRASLEAVAFRGL